MAWVVAAATSALDGRDVIGIDVAGRRLAIYRLNDGYFATSDTCPHAAASLSDGCVVEGYIECPVHSALFDIRTGASDGSMTPRNLVTFPVRVEADRILVDIPMEHTAG